MEFKLQAQSPISKDQLHQNKSLKSKASSQQQSNEIVGEQQQLFSNGYANQMFFNRYARSEYIVAAGVTMNLSLILIYFEMNLQGRSIKTWLLYMTTILQFFCSNYLSFISVFTLFVNYIIYNQYKTQQNRQFQLKKPLELVFYTFILLIKPYPFFQGLTIQFQNQKYFQKHQVNDLLCIFSLSEIFLIAPAMFVYSKFHTLRSQRISEMYGARASYLFALKCWFKENSGFVIAVLFTSWFMLCALATRMVEYQTYKKLKSMENSIWFTFITMATVGFGDLAPITNIGFIVNTFTMYSGVIILSITVMLLRNLFDLTPRTFCVISGERRTLVIMNSLQEKLQLRCVATAYIRESLWRLWRNKRRQLQGKEPHDAKLTQRNLRVQFKTLRRQSQRINYQSNIKDEFTNNFAKIFGYMNNLNENQDTMIHFFHSKRS